MTPERFKKSVTVLNQRQPDLTVVTDEVHKSQNISAIIRTCDAVGIMELHSVYDADTFKAHTGTTLGTHKWVKTNVYPTINTPLVNLKNDIYQIVVADISSLTVDYRDIDYTRPTALLLGAEKFGLSKAAREHVDQFISIPMQGMVESFNVSVACAIILLKLINNVNHADSIRVAKFQMNVSEKLFWSGLILLLLDTVRNIL
jgi:tRNA (guanosine-2'-O-)-methyltransferase